MIPTMSNVNTEFFAEAQNAHLREAGHVRLYPNLHDGASGKSELAQMLVGIAQQLGTPYRVRDRALIQGPRSSSPPPQCPPRKRKDAPKD